MHVCLVTLAKKDGSQNEHGAHLGLDKSIPKQLCCIGVNWLQWAIYILRNELGLIPITRLKGILYTIKTDWNDYNP